MNLKHITFIIIYFVSFALFSQTIEPSSGIKKRYFQIEFETIYSIQKKASKTIKSWSIPSVLCRYGLSKNIELQVNLPIVRENLYENDYLIHSLYKFDNIQIGLSMNIWKKKKIITEGALLLRAILPIHKNLKFSKIGHIVSLNMSKILTDKFTVSINFGIVTEITKTTTGFYIANVDFKPNTKIHFFIENFGDFNSVAIISHNVNSGFGFIINKSLAIDFSVANGINHHLFYIGGVITWKPNSK